MGSCASHDAKAAPQAPSPGTWAAAKGAVKSAAKDPTPPATSGDSSPAGASPQLAAKDEPAPTAEADGPRAEDVELPPTEAADDQQTPAEVGKEDQLPTEAEKEEQPPAEAAEEQPPAEAAEEQPPAEAAEEQPPAEAAEEQPPAEAAEEQPPAETEEEQPPAEAAEEEQPPAEAAEEQPERPALFEPAAPAAAAGAEGAPAAAQPEGSEEEGGGDEAPAAPANVTVADRRAGERGRTLHVVTFEYDGRAMEAARYYTDFAVLRKSCTELRDVKAPFPKKTLGACTGRKLEERTQGLDAWVRAAVAAHWPCSGRWNQQQFATFLGVDAGFDHAAVLDPAASGVLDQSTTF